MTPNVPCDTIRNAVNRSIDDGHKKVCLPWAIGGCASEYQIVNYQIKDKKLHPTPVTCKYQKIVINQSKLAS